MPEVQKETILERYKQLVGVLHEQASILNLEQLLDQGAKAALELCQAQHAQIFIPDKANQRLQFKTGTFPNATKYRQISMPVELSLEGWVLSHKQPLRINNYRGYDPHYGKVTNPHDLEIRSILCLPLISKGTPIGVLEVFNETSGKFTDLDQEILSSFAQQLATYIFNTQLFLQSDLISELVHELRTPLVSLNMAVHLLQHPDLPEEKRRRIFEMISTEFNRLSEMTASFLEYARLESGRTKFNPTQFDIQQVLAESVEVMQFQADARSIKIQLQPPASPLVLTADRDKLKQVILNLLNNAIKYNHPGGSVSISAQPTPTDMTIIVRDNGQGISAEYLPRLFDRFFRAPNKDNLTIGTGLGLTICKQIVDAHHGKLEVSSEVGRGSTFTVRLPVIHEDEFIPVE